MGTGALNLLMLQLMLQLNSVLIIHVAPLQTLVNRPGDPGATEGGPANTDPADSSQLLDT